MNQSKKENLDPINWKEIFEKIPDEVKISWRTLRGSYNTYLLNVKELSDILEFIEDEPAPALDETDSYEILQGRLHNYLASSYTLEQNIETILRDLGGEAYDEYNSKFKSNIAHRRIRGLRLFAQHNRPLYFEYKVDEDSNYEVEEIRIDLESLLEEKEDWDNDAIKHFFDQELQSSSYVDVVNAIKQHIELIGEMKDWIKTQISNYDDRKDDG